MRNLLSTPPRDNKSKVIIKLIVGVFFDETISQWHLWGYIGFIIVTVIWLAVVEKSFIRWLGKEEFVTAKETLGRNLKLQQIKRKSEARSAAEEYRDGSGI